MPFLKKERDHQLKVQGAKCQTTIYTEAKGFHTCNSTKDLELDHLYPESQLIYDGSRDPNNSPGILRCREHHTGQGMTKDEDMPGFGRIAHYGESQWSRHPDVGQALAEYREGDINAFKKVGKAHVEAAARGERITNDDYGVVLYEHERVSEMNTRHAITTGEKRPESKPHPKFKKKHWWDGLFD